MNAGISTFNTFDPNGWVYKTLLKPSTDAVMEVREKLFNQVEEVSPPPKNIGDYLDPRKWFGATPTTPDRLPEQSQKFYTELGKTTKDIKTIGDLTDLDSLPKFTHTLGEGVDSISLNFGKEELTPIIKFLQLPAETIDKKLLEATFDLALVKNNPALLTFAEELGLKVKNGAVLLDDLNLLELNDIKVQAEVLRKQNPSKILGKLFDKSLKEIRRTFNFTTVVKGVEKGEASFDYFQNLKGMVRKVPYIGDWLINTFDSPHKPSVELGFIDTAFTNNVAIQNAFTGGLKAGAKETAKAFGTETLKSIKGAGPLGWIISLVASFGDIKKGYDEGNVFKMLYAPLRTLVIGGAATALFSLALPFILPALPFVLPAWGASALTFMGTIGAGMALEQAVGKGEQIAGGFVNGFGAGGHNAGQASPFNNPTVASGMPSSSGLSSGSLSPAGQEFYNSLGAL